MNGSINSLLQSSTHCRSVILRCTPTFQRFPKHCREQLGILATVKQQSQTEVPGTVQPFSTQWWCWNGSLSPENLSMTVCGLGSFLSFSILVEHSPLAIVSIPDRAVRERESTHHLPSFFSCPRIVVLPPNMETCGLKYSNPFSLYTWSMPEVKWRYKIYLLLPPRIFSGKLFSFIKHIKTYKVGLLMYLYSHKLISLK